MRRLMNVVPAAVSFGPLLMIIGLDFPYRIGSLVGALITSVGILIIFANVTEMLNAANPISVPTLGQRRALMISLVLGVVGMLALLVIGFLLISKPHV